MSEAGTLGTLLDDTARRLAAAGIEEPRREARALAKAVFADAPSALYDRSRLIGLDRAATLRAAAARRARREPLARILGCKEFWSLSFALSKETLVPRPDSETLVEAALALLPEEGRAYRLLDFGTGSGCLLLAILSERPAAFGIGVDRSTGAVRQAAANARALALAPRATFLVADWGAALSSSFDLIVSNPPYVESEVLSELAPEVARHDPVLALDGGSDGLTAYRAVVPQAAALLAPGGSLVLEIGQGQCESVAGLLGASGLVELEVNHDLSGIARTLSASRPLQDCNSPDRSSDRSKKGLGSAGLGR